MLNAKASEAFLGAKRMKHRLPYLSGTLLVLSIPFDLAFQFEPILAQIFGPEYICSPQSFRCVPQTYLYYTGLSLILLPCLLPAAQSFTSEGQRTKCNVTKSAATARKSRSRCRFRTAQPQAESDRGEFGSRLASDGYGRLKEIFQCIFATSGAPDRTPDRKFRGKSWARQPFHRPTQVL